MQIITIEEIGENGAHQYQSLSVDLDPIPEGYAVIPEDMDIPDTLPYVNIEVSNIDGVPTVTAMTGGVVPPPPEPPEPGVSPVEQLRADVDYIAAMTGVEL